VTAALLHDVGHLLAGLDDAAKDLTLQVPDLARYRPIPESCLKTAG
jgi:predicted HD phosphohydrolase